MVGGETKTAAGPYGEPLPGQAAFMDFMQHCWSEVRAENHGAPNVYGTAARMYLYLAGTCGVIPEATLPREEEFIHSVRDAMLQREIFRNSLYPGAKHAAKAMHDLGPLMFWTAGDMHGGRDSNGDMLKGSWEQLFRVVKSGVMEYIAQGSMLSPDSNVNVCGAEDKVACLPRCFTWLQEHGAREIVVLEDKLGNLEQVQQFVGGMEGTLKLHLVWVRQGKHGDTGDEAPAGVHSLDSILDVPQLLKALQLESPGFLADYDGVFSNDDCRRFFQQRAVLACLRRLGWLREELVFI